MEDKNNRLPLKYFTDRQLYNKVKRYLKVETYFDIETLDDNGVYILGDFYIGKSKNIRKRMIEHLAIHLPFYPTGFENLKKFKKIERYLINNELIPVKLLSLNQDDEGKLIKEYVEKGYQLTNTVFNPNKKKQLKIWYIKIKLLTLNKQIKI